MKYNSDLPEYRFNQILLKLSKLEIIDEGEIQLCFRMVNEAVVEALGIERSSIWFYTEDQSAISCIDLFEKSSNRHSTGTRLEARDFPNYFKYLKEERTLPAHNAFTDPATSEFSEVYLKPLNIYSMLDAPIRVGGKMIGVICCESVNQEKIWQVSDEIFIGNITDILARAIQARERIKAMLALEEMNLNLESIIKERTEQLNDQRARTENASKMALLGEMASAIAHEINNPLAIIMGQMNILKDLEQEGVNFEEKEQYFVNIKNTILRIDKIVKGLRFFARDASVDVFKKSSVKKIVSDTLILCNQKFYLKGIKITTFFPEQDIAINCQPVSISQALLNLLSNSYDAIEDENEKWIRIECREKGKVVELVVTDSGKGIAPEIKDRVMIPFFTTKPVGKGTGLGLAIVKGIVEQHKGAFNIIHQDFHPSFVMSFPKIKAA